MIKIDFFVKQLQLLFSPDYEVVSVLGEVILIPEEGKTFVEAIVDFFQAHNHLENLLEWAIAKEINSTCKCFISHRSNLYSVD